ncbi:DUF357 domain-containing protein [Candidatus Micrarchaeota archaeon]|nr:DUF357 domain-containing protein [Candidatus Micrarchaeota archaeon]
MVQIRKKTGHYEGLTKQALEIISLEKDLNLREKKIAADFLEMAQNYFADAQYFKQENDWLTALAAFSYAHAWLDAGVRAGYLNGQNNNQLFVLPKAKTLEMLK